MTAVCAAARLQARLVVAVIGLGVLARFVLEVVLGLVHAEGRQRVQDLRRDGASRKDEPPTWMRSASSTIAASTFRSSGARVPRRNSRPTSYGIVGKVVRRTPVGLGHRA